MDDEYFTFTADDLPIVLNEFFKAFKGNPLDFIPMEEAIALWNEDFKLIDGKYEVSENETKAFLDKINGIQVDRLMHSMDKKGLATLGHDGKDFCLILKT